MVKSSREAPTAAPSVSPDEALGARLRDAREARQLSQTAVATRSKFADPEGKGISRTALIGYEANTSRPGARELRILCEVLVVSPNMLLFGTDHPLQTAHPALEGLRTASAFELKQAVEIALVMAALKGHERDALVSLTLSLAGRQLGDARLGGLRVLGSMLLPEIERSLQEALPGADLGAMTLESIVEAVSQHQGSNKGNNLRYDESKDEMVGTPLYQDPGKRDKS